MSHEKYNELIQKTLPFVFFAIVIITSSYYIFIHKSPYRLYNSDVFHQLAVIRSFENDDLLHTNDGFFKDGPVDLHAGPFYFTLYVTKIFTNISYYNVILLATLFSIIFITISLYIFATYFELSREKALFFTLISLIGWGSYSFFFAGMYDFSNLLATGSFGASMGIGGIIITLSLFKKYFDDSNLKIVILLILLSSTLLVSHFLSGIILFSFVSLLIIEDIFKNRKISRKSVNVIVIILISIITSLFIWPLFNILTLLTSSQTVQVGDSGQIVRNNFTLPDWTTLLGLTTLGIIFIPQLYKEKKFFLLLLLISSGVITASYLFPVRISLYWRYFPFIFTGLSLILCKYIDKINKTLISLLLITFLILGINNFKTKKNLLLSRQIFQSSEMFEIAGYIENSSVILSDPNTSYHLGALYDIQTVSVPYNHANPAYIKQSKIRYEDNLYFLMGDLTYDEQKNFIDKYSIKYILINNNYFPDYIGLNEDRSWLKSFNLLIPNKVLFSDNNLILYELQ